MTKYDFYIKRDDTRPWLERQILDANDKPVSLPVGTTVRFIMRLDSAPDLSTPKVDREAEIINATEGRVRYKWASGDTDTIGIYYGEFEITLADASKFTAPNDSHIDIQVYVDLNLT